MAKKFDIDKFNEILENNGQSLFAISITGTEIVLSNGIKIIDSAEIRKCKRRVMNYSKEYIIRFDEIYSTNLKISEQALMEAKSCTSKAGGKACQDKHGEKIKNNLNTGVPWNKDMKGEYPYSYACSEEAKLKISKANSGRNNGMYGKQMSEEDKQLRSNTMKNAILSGKFTPNSNNRNTHWDSYFNGKPYRSSWEALYQSLDKDAEYETLRIPYTFEDGEYVYIVDFVNHKTKKAIEVKPKKMYNDKKTLAKIDALNQWCSGNEYTLLIADEAFFVSHECPCNHLFDDNTYRKIKKLYETYK